MIILRGPTAKNLETGAINYAKGGFVTTGVLFDPETECEQTVPSDTGHGILWEPNRLDLTKPISVTNTFTYSRRQFRQIIKLFGLRYRLPGDKPLIHKGKKP